MGLKDSNVTEEWQHRSATVTPAGSARKHDPCFGAVFVRGQGARLIDAEGNTWIDLTCGFSATNFGHCHPRLIRAMARQAAELGHVTGDPHPRRIELAEALVSRFHGIPGQQLKAIFTTSGARAVEAAWKIASSHRPGRLIALAPSLHGRSIATSILSSTTKTDLSQSLESRILLRPVESYPYCARCPLGMAFPSCETTCADDLLSLIRQESSTISAVLVEPALTARGYVFPPAEWFQRLRKVTKECSVTLIADEIQTGMGRCGGLLLSHEQGWEADLTLLGKSLGGGLTSIACVIGSEALVDCLPAGAESETGAANPIACAVALESIATLEDEALYENGSRVGEALRQTCSDLLPPAMTRVEGQAACCAIEFIRDGNELEQDQRLANAFASACARQRLKVHLSGPAKTRVVMLPPLVMTDDELGDAQRRLGRVVEQMDWADPSTQGRTDD